MQGRMEATILAVETADVTVPLAPHANVPIAPHTPVGIDAGRRAPVRTAAAWQVLAAGLWWPVLAPRAAALAGRCSPHLRGRSLLDLGAGSGHLACAFARRGSRATLLDVAPHRGALGERLFFQPIATRLARSHGLPYALYDGCHIPFPDRAFDTVLLSFVLHHTAGPEALLAEAARVARHRVVVVEDACAARPARWLDALLNLEIGHPGGQRSRDGWSQLFGAAGLRTAHEESWRVGYGPLALPALLFVLEHNSADAEQATSHRTG